MKRSEYFANPDWPAPRQCFPSARRRTGSIMIKLCRRTERLAGVAQDYFARGVASRQGRSRRLADEIGGAFFQERKARAAAKLARTRRISNDGGLDNFFPVEVEHSGVQP